MNDIIENTETEIQTNLSENNDDKIELVETSTSNEEIMKSTEEAESDIPLEDELTNDTSEAQKLRNEIDRLKALLEEKESEQAKILNELGEFNKLFPDITLAQIPCTVWEKVEGGLPLSAAYALYEKEESVRLYKANSINTKNASLSPGSAGKNTGGDYYSPDEVRKMSQKEVHENYSKIKKSMKYWR